MRGHWAQIQQTKADAPYLMYDAVGDADTRPEHAAWDGLVLPADAPWWSTHYPPNDWGCRCGVIQLSADQVQRLGKDGPDTAPADKLREWTNPRTGAIEMVPAGVGPGWAYAPGASRGDELRDQLAQKEQAFRDGR
ncbi:phage head morphogenesis protein [Aquabacterium sp. OR-4]|uniref:phage head morphogenesis protein n=1 Tax=Aquabacterium sp. OR-4 TaxID=2978127 RepID=UPI0021B49AD1|nr:phage minor head protein [Aquabacterium sp. OR-4]MDT7838205.1 phage minor head protein [Aquabacterium sp. OR-4]